MTSSSDEMASSFKDGEDENKKLDKRTKFTFGIILMVAFTASAVYALPSPFLPNLNDQHGIGTGITGWMLGIYALARFITCSILSKTMYKVGLRELMCWGSFIIAVCSTLFGLMEFMPVIADRTDWTYIILGFTIRFFQAVGGGAFFAGALTTVTILAHYNAIAMLGLMETMFGMGCMCAPALGSALYKFGGFMLVFAVPGGLLLLSCTLMCIFLPHNLIQKKKSNASTSFLSLLKSLRITSTVIFTTFSAAIFSCLNPILEPELRTKFGLTPATSALAFFLITAAYGITTPILGKIIDKKKSINCSLLLTFGMFMFSLVLLVAGPSPLLPFLKRPLWFLLVCLALFGFFLAFVMMSSYAICFSPDEYGNEYDRGLITVTRMSAFSIGEFFGPSIAGELNAHSSFAWTTTFFAFGCFICGILVLLIYFILAWKKKRLIKDEVKNLQNWSDEETPLLIETDRENP